MTVNVSMSIVYALRIQFPPLYKYTQRVYNVKAFGRSSLYRSVT